MGISRGSLKIFSTLYQKKFFNKINSVMELGAQVVYVEHKDDISLFLKSIGRENPSLDLKKAYKNKIFKRETLRGRVFPKSYLLDAKNIIYKSLGVKNYECIDSSGELGAHKFDLNKDIVKEYNYKKKFDLVTNFGTSEHVFNQDSCFRNMHNLTNVGGYMYHDVSFVGYLEHGFYIYSALFFRDLAIINNYEIKAMWLRFDDKVVVPYSGEIADEYLIKPGKKYGTITCLLRKTNENGFQVPFQGRYVETTKLNYINENSKIKFPHPKDPFRLMKIVKKILNVRI